MCAVSSIQSAEVLSTAKPKVTPIPFWQTLLFFGVPGIGIFLTTRFLVPWLVDQGMALIWAWTFAVFVPYYPVGIGVIVHHFLQPGNNWQTFMKRFRLTLPTRQDLKWVLLAFPVIFVLNFSLDWTQPIVTSVFPRPDPIPEVYADPYAATEAGSEMGTFFGEPLADNWMLIPFWFWWVTVAVFMEDIIWRGYLLPRMELTYGKRAWLVNGLLWDVPFHLYTLWNVFTDLPMMLIIPYIAQRRKNTWTAMILHGGMAAIAYVIIIPGVLGW